MGGHVLNVMILWVVSGPAGGPRFHHWVSLFPFLGSGMMGIRYSVGNLIPGQILERNLISFWGVWDSEILDLVWEGSLNSHFERNIDFLDFELDFGGLFDLEMVPKVIYGSHWGSQGCPLGVLGANLDFVDFLHIQRTPRS